MAMGQVLAGREAADVTQQQLGLAQAGLGLQGLLGLGGLTGQIQGQETLQAELGRGQLGLAERAQTEVERAQRQQEAFTGRALTEQERATRAQEALAGRQVAVQESRNAFDQALQATEQRARLAGTFEGQATVAERQREFDNRLRESELFGGTPPVTMTLSEDGMPVEFQAAYQSRMGDGRYDQRFDADANGVIDYNDYVQVAARTENLGNGMAVYTPPGPQTLAARQLGVEERRLGEAARQFDQTFGQQISEFQSTFSGYLVGPDGQLQSIEVTDPTTGQVVVKQPSLMERDQYERQLERFENFMSGPQQYRAVVNTRGERVYGTETQLREQGFDPNAMPPGWSYDQTWAGGAAIAEMTPIEFLMRTMGFEGDMADLNDEQQLALTQSVMSFLFQPVSPTPFPRGPGAAEIFMSGLGALGSVGAAAAMPG